jgi:calcium/calmodulin-dependent protein kinase I
LSNLQGDQLKIIDFNISKRNNILFDKNNKNNMKMYTHIGTLEYSAPEVLEGYTGYSEQIDMWSAGIILYYMLSQKSPFRTEK